MPLMLSCVSGSIICLNYDAIGKGRNSDLSIDGPCHDVEWSILPYSRPFFYFDPMLFSIEVIRSNTMAGPCASTGERLAAHPGEDEWGAGGDARARGGGGAGRFAGRRLARTPGTPKAPRTAHERRFAPVTCRRMRGVSHRSLAGALQAFRAMNISANGKRFAP